MLTPPFKYFGGKRRIANRVWEILGDPKVYIEPFAGSAAVLLARPEGQSRCKEILNDADGHITNIWRAIRYAPDQLSDYLDGWVVSELDLHAATWKCREGRSDLTRRLCADPEWFDVKMAAWAIYGYKLSVGNNFTNRGPWSAKDGLIGKYGEPGIIRGVPDIGARRGLFPKGSDLDSMMHGLSQRLSFVSLLCGDWKRAVRKSMWTGKNLEDCGFFLDPPYTEGDKSIYRHHHNDLVDEVRQWALEEGNKGAKIVLCGYEDEHDALLDHGWSKEIGRAGGAGYGHQKADSKERIWVSPGCEQ